MQLAWLYFDEYKFSTDIDKTEIDTRSEIVRNILYVQGDGTRVATEVKKIFFYALSTVGSIF